MQRGCYTHTHTARAKSTWSELLVSLVSQDDTRLEVHIPDGMASELLCCAEPALNSSQAVFWTFTGLFRHILVEIGQLDEKWPCSRLLKIGRQVRHSLTMLLTS